MLAPAHNYPRSSIPCHSVHVWERGAQTPCKLQVMTLTDPMWQCWMHDCQPLLCGRKVRKLIDLHFQKVSIGSWGAKKRSVKAATRPSMKVSLSFWLVLIASFGDASEIFQDLKGALTYNQPRSDLYLTCFKWVLHFHRFRNAKPVWCQQKYTGPKFVTKINLQNNEPHCKESIENLPLLLPFLPISAVINKSLQLKIVLNVLVSRLLLWFFPQVPHVIKGYRREQWIKLLSTTGNQETDTLKGVRFCILLKWAWTQKVNICYVWYLVIQITNQPFMGKQSIF